MKDTLNEITQKHWENFPDVVESDDSSQYYYRIVKRRAKTIDYSLFGSKLELAFVNSKRHVKSSCQFNTKNWNDPLLGEIRAVLTNLYGHPQFKHTECNSQIIYSRETDNYMTTITLLWHEDQTTVSICVLDKQCHNYPTYAFISWYKNRGRTEKFLSYDLTNIDLEDAVTIHKALME